MANRRISPARPGAKRVYTTSKVFIARFDPGATTLDYLVVFIGDVEDFIKDIAVDSVGNVYAAGSTDSTDFPSNNRGV